MIPFFSIIIPLYNKENFIEATLNSAIKQNFKDFEIIVINDGSTDDSLKVVKSIKDERIKIYTIKNNGVSYARNYGIKRANANLIAFLDADDYWYPNHLSTLKKQHDSFPNCGLYANAYEKKILDKTITSIYNTITLSQNWMGIVDNFFKASLINSIAWTSAVMVPKSIILKVGGFDEHITLGAGEDTDLWIRLALNYKVAFCNTVTAIHNLHAENRISNSNTNLRQFLDLDKYEKFTSEKKFLKKFLDNNRFSIAIQYLLANNKVKAKDYVQKIDLKNLNFKQRIVIKLSPFVLRFLFKIKSILKGSWLNFSLYN